MQPKNNLHKYNQYHYNPKLNRIIYPILISHLHFLYLLYPLKNRKFIKIECLTIEYIFVKFLIIT